MPNSWLAIFVSNKNEVPFCAIGPDHAIEHLNKIMKIQGGLKGLKQPAVMARWFLIASDLSRLSNEAETFAGIVSTKQTRHHDASPSVVQRYEQNVNKLRYILMVNDPFTVADDVLMNIITKAVMLDPVKNAIIQRNFIGQEMFDKFVQERLVDKEMSIWSPMKKVKLLIWKSTRKVNKCTTSDKLVAMNDDRELFARFLVVILTRPELNL